MAGLAEIQTIIETLKNVDTITEAVNDEEISALVSDFSKLEGNLKEYMQDITRNNILEIVGKLSRDESLTPEEVRYIELWIVGDAENYIELEKNFGDWIIETNRLINDIKGYAGKEIDLEACNRMRAISRDAVRNASDIEYFVSERERIKKFKESSTKIDTEARETLVHILRSKMKSETS